MSNAAARVRFAPDVNVKTQFLGVLFFVVVSVMTVYHLIEKLSSHT